MMRRLSILTLVTSIFLLAMSASVALAQNPHFKPQTGQPTCTITTNGSTASVVCSGTLAGLANDDLVILVTVSGFAIYQCQNGGGNTAPGQNRVLVGPVVAPTDISGDEFKNGNLKFTTDPATLTAPPTVSGAAAGCPNPNWTGVNPTLTVTDVDLAIEQPEGTEILTCSAPPPTLSGTFQFTDCAFK
jgi:hypothetical protein